MNSQLRFLQKHVLPALVIFGLALALSRTDIMEKWENDTLDLRTRFRRGFQPPVDPRQVVVGIDDDSIDEKAFGKWPWQRQIHGGLLLYAAPEKPAVVTWDLLFVETDTVEPRNDAILVQGAKKARPATVIFGATGTEVAIEPNEKRLTKPLTNIEGDLSKLLASPFIAEPIAALGEVSKMAFVDTPAGPDGVRRLVPLLVNINGKVYPSLALQSLLAYWHVPDDKIVVRLNDSISFPVEGGERRIPIDETGAYLINYRHSVAGFHPIGYFGLMQMLETKYKTKEVPKDFPALENKIILIGQMSTGLSDNGPTPFSPETPLVLVHANVIDNVLKEDYARRAPNWPFWIGGFALGALGSFLFAKRRLADQAIYAVGVPALLAAAATFAWIKWSLWIPLVWPINGFVLVQVFIVGRRVLEEQKAKAEIKGMFGTYVSPQLVSKLVDAGKPPQLGGHEDEITAYFSDIQAFSSFSEKLTPLKLVELMNEYLTACTDIVQEEGGTLDKYIGDAVVAMFGAPVPLKDHALRACIASQRVHVKLGQLRDKWTSEGDTWPEIVCKMQSRIGLNSGNCIIGNMGSRTRFNYTMMGDNVNLAARMESGSKSWGAYTMCAEATKLLCERDGPGRIVFRPLGRIVVKGRSLAVPIFELVGLKENVSQQTHDCIGIFEQALAKHFARDWDGAIKLFEQSKEIEPNIPGKTPGVVSNPSLVYIHITEHYKEEPPAEGWDGVYIMKEK